MKLLSVQYLRAVAAVAVVLSHCVTILNPASRFGFLVFGEYGVDLFFVISGFIIVSTTATPSADWRVFLKRRATRIVPLYWLATAAFSLLIVLAPAAVHSSTFDVKRLALSMLFIPHYHAVLTQEIQPLLIQGWTLNFEVFFYACFAACMAISRAYRTALVCILIAGSVILGRVVHSDNAVFRTYTGTLCIEFLYGAILGHVYLARKEATFPYISLGMAVAAVCALLFAPHERWLAAGSLGATLVAATVWMEKKDIPFRDKTILYIGDASYAIYLFHTFALGGFRFIFARLHLPLNSLPVEIGGMIVAAGTAVLFGCALHSYLERPLTEWLNRQHQPRRHQPVTAPLAAD